MKFKLVELIRLRGPLTVDGLHQKEELRSFNANIRSLSTHLSEDLEDEKPRATSDAKKLLDKLYNSVRAQRFEEIVVIQTKFNAGAKYIILANAFNFRHLVSGTEQVNKHYKTTKSPDEEFARLSISSEWNVLDFKSVIVHLFSKKCRQHFDVEQLWTCGEKYDDLTNFPESVDSTTSPPTFLSLDGVPGSSATDTTTTTGSSGDGIS